MCHTTPTQSELVAARSSVVPPTPTHGAISFPASNVEKGVVIAPDEGDELSWLLTRASRHDSRRGRVVMAPDEGDGFHELCDGDKEFGSEPELLGTQKLPSSGHSPKFRHRH